MYCLLIFGETCLPLQPSVNSLLNMSFQVSKAHFPQRMPELDFDGLWRFLLLLKEVFFRWKASKVWARAGEEKKKLVEIYSED